MSSSSSSSSSSTSSLPSGWGITLLPGDAVTTLPTDSSTTTSHVVYGSLQSNASKLNTATATATATATTTTTTTTTAENDSLDVASINPGQLESTLATQEYIQMAISKRKEKQTYNSNSATHHLITSSPHHLITLSFIKHHHSDVFTIILIKSFFLLSCLVLSCLVLSLLYSVCSVLCVFL